MALEDIERLKEKVDKDPNSRLFIPLAEEYKKAGMFDEAIDVLNKGLERQPGYMSARVFLGKIYLEKGMLDEARAEFEKVISAIPDNLYAHKKLAEIYKDIGEKDKAIKEFKAVLKLNPIDEWAATSLADIEKGSELRPEVPEVVKAEETIHPKTGIAEEIEEGKISEILVEEEILPEIVEKAEEPKLEKLPVVEEVTEDESLSFEDILKESEGTVEEIEKALEEEEVPKQPLLSIKDADPYISQDRYMEAMKVYRDLLSTEPDNMHVMQRLEELKALLKLLGKDKEELIERLNSLLHGIKKRRDEFFGST